MPSDKKTKEFEPGAVADIPKPAERTLQDWASILEWPASPPWVLSGALASRPTNQTYTREEAEAIGAEVRGLKISPKA